MSNPATHAPTMDNMIQAMTGLNTSPIAPRIVNVNNDTHSEEAVGDYKPTTDERVFSDFTTDGSEKDYRQEALLQVSGSPLAYKENQEKKQADIDNLRDMADQVNDDLQDAQKERMERALRENFGYDPTTGMMKINGVSVSKDVLDETIKKAKSNPDEYAREANIAADDVPLSIAFMEEYQQAIENGASEKQLLQIYEKYPERVTEPTINHLEQETKTAIDLANQREANNQGVLSNDQLTATELEEKHEVADSWFDDMGFDDEPIVNDYGSLASSTDDLQNSSSVMTINSEYNSVAQGELVSTSNVAELNNLNDYQVTDGDLVKSKPIEVAIG